VWGSQLRSSGKEVAGDPLMACIDLCCTAPATSHLYNLRVVFENTYKDMLSAGASVDNITVVEEDA
jgi:hypothetical protein